jgi:hypothetical protein
MSDKKYVELEAAKKSIRGFSAVWSSSREAICTMLDSLAVPVEDVCYECEHNFTPLGYIPPDAIEGSIEAALVRFENCLKGIDPEKEWTHPNLYAEIERAYTELAHLKALSKSHKEEETHELEANESASSIASLRRPVDIREIRPKIVDILCEQITMLEKAEKIIELIGRSK